MPKFTAEDDSFKDLKSGNYMGEVAECEERTSKKGEPQVLVKFETPHGTHTEWIKLVEKDGKPVEGFPHTTKTQNLLRAMSIPDAAFWERYDGEEKAREPLDFEWSDMIGESVYFELRKNAKGYTNMEEIGAAAPVGVELGPVAEVVYEKDAGMPVGDDVPF